WRRPSPSGGWAPPRTSPPWWRSSAPTRPDTSRGPSFPSTVASAWDTEGARDRSTETEGACDRSTKTERACERSNGWDDPDRNPGWSDPTAPIRSTKHTETKEPTDGAG